MGGMVGVNSGESIQGSTGTCAIYGRYKRERHRRVGGGEVVGKPCIKSMG